MLRPDKAEKELATFRSDLHFSARLSRVKKLPKAAKEAGFILLNRDTDGNPILNWQQQQKLKQNLGARLERLADKQRLELFTALYPKLAKHLEATWQLFATLPYQTGYQRKSFRAPAHPAAARARRLQWLNGTLERLHSFDPDAEWLATWAGYLHYHSSDDNSGYTLAAAINGGGAEGQKVYDILKDSASNLHPIGAMGRHVTRALFVCEKPEAWTFMEKFLLAAQRQEGLRQVILETVDEAHPQAFRRMLRLIRDHELARFSAVVRSVDVWFGFMWDSATITTVNKAIDRAISYLDDPKERQAALKSDDGEQTYLALWALGFDDVDTALPAAESVLKKGNTESRFATITLLRHLGTPLARKQLLAAMDDTDLRIAVSAFNAALPHCRKPTDTSDEDYEDEEWLADEVEDMFERIEKLYARLPDSPQSLKALVWPWSAMTVSKDSAAGQLPYYLGKRPPERLLPYLPKLGSWQKVQAMQTLVQRKPLREDVRDVLFTLVRDSSSYVRNQAVSMIEKLKLEPGEPEKLEVALTRGASDLRRAVLAVLMKQKEKAIDESADRLLVSSNKNQRLAGLDLLVALADDGRQGDARRQRGEQYRADRGKKITEEEESKLSTLAKTILPKATLDNGLGLLDVEAMNQGTPPKKHDDFVFMSPAAALILKDLDDLIDKHREHTYTVENNGKTETHMLGTNGFPAWNAKLSDEENFARVPLLEVWEDWYRSRPKAMRDEDGMELYRAELWLSSAPEWTIKHWKEYAGSSSALQSVFKLFTAGQEHAKARYRNQVAWLLWLFRRRHPEPNELEWMIDATEASWALVPKAELARDQEDADFRDWRGAGLFKMWTANLSYYAHSKDWTPERVKRYWGLLKWKETSIPKANRQRTDIPLLLLAYKYGAATDADVLDHLIGPRLKTKSTYGYYYGPGFDALQQLTRRLTPTDAAKTEPHIHKARALAQKVADRILEIELERGELTTAASEPAQAVQALDGTYTLFTLLCKLGNKRLERSGYGQSYTAVFSHLIQVTYPKSDDTPEQFAALAKVAIKDGRVPADRFLELAFFAPQWLKHVAAFIGWPGYEEAVYWFQAHISGAKHYDPKTMGVAEEGEDESDDEETPPGQRKKTGWEALLAERTPLTDTERNEGAVDAEWFWRVFEPLGAKKWESLATAAKYASSYGAGAKKALFLAQVLRGKAKKRDLVRGIRERQLKENVRCLGLLPLASGQKREPDLLNRYKILQEFLRYARSLGPMSREATIRTGQIGLENLARTAGYPDPIRLEWAMEAKTVADLKAGPISRTFAGVTVTLKLLEDGLPETTFKRGERELKSLPSAVRKDRKVAELMDRKADLRRQASRMKWSLESAMIRGDEFTGAELRTLMEHPMLEPRLSRLVLIGDGIMGYPVKAGKGLENYAGKVEPVKANEKLRIAHCHDLFASKKWHEWQADVFKRERVQPFKQVFRELYLVSDAEKADHDKSTRYSGQQVNPNQANALWGGRGWATKDEVRKRFREAGIAAEVFFQYGYGTPLEVEGLTLDAVRFYKKDDWRPMALADVPPRIFSEVMRDCDLVVSVAHRGGVDPEASQSTVEMRASLLRETCQLLKMANVRVQGNRALIDGELNNYALHLGSGVVHRMPGGSVCIIPVHGQHRGRIFLPFADEDPKTAEVISKTILLARDSEIQDPTILDQLRVVV